MYFLDNISMSVCLDVVPRELLSNIGAQLSLNMLDRRSLVQAPDAPRDQSQHPRARKDYDEETAHESYMNPEPGFQSGPGDSVDAD